MEHGLLCCDWGTSSCRLRLIDDRDLKIIAEVQSDEGVNHTFKGWKEQLNSQGLARYYFFLEKLK